MIMFRKKNIFISHSSKNKDIAEQLCAFLNALGIINSRIFCSSVVGQGVNNGEKLNDAIAKAIHKSKVLIYIISRDFVDSSYCMEELGAGWFLSQNNRATCFYLKLPDVELYELSGFVNSKIDKFSFLDEQHQGELGLFAENLFGKLNKKLPKHSYLLNAENTFFSATKIAFNNILEQKEQLQKEKEKKKNEIESLKEQLQAKEVSIERYKKIIQTNQANEKHKEAQIELDTIRNRFFYLGLGDGVSKKLFSLVFKNFWFDMINRYLELEEKLGYSEKGYDCHMEWLLATVFSANGDVCEAYEHMKKYVQLNETTIYPDFYEHIKIDPANEMSEIIEILKDKLIHTKKGIAYDSYEETLKSLELRKESMHKGDE